MKILSADDIRSWDEYTIREEPVSSLDLMERAAAKCTGWLEEQGYTSRSFIIFCGKGNNGGDGLAIARMLAEKQCPVQVYILEFGHKGTEDFQANLARLHQYPDVIIRFIQSEENFHPLEKDHIVIDALFGSGLNRALDGVTANLVTHINQSGCQVIAIDIPSGMFVDRSSAGNIRVAADHTLTFQCYKAAFLVPENAAYTGTVSILDIGLHPAYYDSVSSRFELLDKTLIRSIRKPRQRFSHKGNFGHALLVAGSHGKMGAALLSAEACLRSGAGLLSCHIPADGYSVLQTGLPEAMVITDANSSFNTAFTEDLSLYDAIGIGPGLGTAPATKMLLRDLLDSYRNPLVIDADALNIIASQKDLLGLIPPGSVLTPHPKEFARLFGETANDFDRIGLALQKAKELNCIIVLKGHHTLVATSGAQGFFNSTGNPGMATGGSGDVLTGLLTGLLARGYSSVEAALLGVYLHGLAGDLAAEALSMEAMLAGDIIKKIGSAFLTLQS